MEQLPLAQLLVVTVAAGALVTVSLGAGAVAVAAWATGAEATTTPQVPLEQLETVLPQVLQPLL